MVLVSSHSRTFLVRDSELLKRKRINRARVDNKVDSQMFMLPVIEAEALNIVSGPCWKYVWTDMLSFKIFVDGISEIRKTWTGCLFDSFGKESFKTNFIVYFVLVMVDCILC